MENQYHLFQRKYKAADGKQKAYWWYWFWVDGKQVQKPAGRACVVKRIAKEFVAVLEDQDRRRSVPSSTLFGPFALKMFLPGADHLIRQEEKGIAMAETTRTAHRGRVLNYLFPKWEQISLADIQETDFEDWELALKGISNSQRNNLIDTMTIIMQEAKRGRLIDTVPKFERFARLSKRQSTLSDKELFALFPVDEKGLRKIWTITDSREQPNDGLMFGAAFCLAVSAGLRSAELRGVSREQLICKKLPDGGTLNGILVDRALDAKGNATTLKKGSDSDPRTRAVIVPTRTMNVLGFWLKHAKGEGLIFTYHGHPISKEHLLARFNKGLANAKIQMEGRHLTVHGLRYTYNTRMRPLISSEALQEFVGHRSTEMTNLYDRPWLEERLVQLASNTASVEKFWD